MLNAYKILLPENYKGEPFYVDVFILGKVGFTTIRLSQHEAGKPSFEIASPPEVNL